MNRINPNAVSEWSNAGGLFLEYIKLQELLPRTIENASTLLPTSASHLEELKKRWVPMIQNFLTALSRARSADWVVYLKRACVLSGLVAEDVGKALMNTRACLAEMAGQVSVLLTECENLTQLDQVKTRSWGKRGLLFLN